MVGARLRLTLVFVSLGLFACRGQASAADEQPPGRVVIASRLSAPLEVELVDHQGESSRRSFAPGACGCFSLAQASVVRFEAASGHRETRLQADQAYVFVAARGATLVELHQLEFPAAGPKSAVAPSPVRKTRVELERGVLPIRVVLDDREPETLAAWDKRVRKRIEQASKELEPITGVKLEVEAIGSWSASPLATTWDDALIDLEARVPLQGVRLVIGFTRQFAIHPNDYAVAGGLRAPLASHLLVPEVAADVSAEHCLNMLVHELGHFWGGLDSLESNSPMRTNLTSPARPWEAAFDPANALAMSLVADEVRHRGVESLSELSPARRVRIDGIREALAKTWAAHRADRDDGESAKNRAAAPSEEDPLETARIRPDASHGASASTPLRPLFEILVPDVPGAAGIWGGCQTDRRGNVWFVVSSAGIEKASAHLFVCEADSQVPRFRGDVVSQLRAAGLWREGESSGLAAAPMVFDEEDHLYLASVGIDSRDPSTSAPRWGSHLWRIHLPEGRWEHLASVDAAVKAIAQRGPYLYGLAEPGHVVYRWHLRDGDEQQFRAGMIPGHCCRTLIVDRRGHVFVPGTSEEDDDNLLGDAPPTKDLPPVKLFELGPDLKVVGRTPLDDYLSGPLAGATPLSNAGIVGAVAVEQGDVVFVTSVGAVYRIAVPDGDEAAVVTRTAPPQSLGPLTVTAAIASPNGQRYLAAGVHTEGRSTTNEPETVWSLNRGAGQAVVWQPFASGREMRDLRLDGFSLPSQRGIGWFAGAYRRGPLQLSPKVIEVLRGRGFSPEQLTQLEDNARREWQPVLFRVGQSARSREPGAGAPSPESPQPNPR